MVCDGVVSYLPSFPPSLCPSFLSYPCLASLSFLPFFLLLSPALVFPPLHRLCLCFLLVVGVVGVFFSHFVFIFSNSPILYLRFLPYYLMYCIMLYTYRYVYFHLLTDPPSLFFSLLFYTPIYHLFTSPFSTCFTIRSWFIFTMNILYLFSIFLPLHHFFSHLFHLFQLLFIYLFLSGVVFIFFGIAFCLDIYFFSHRFIQHCLSSLFLVFTS